MLNLKLELWGIGILNAEYWNTPYKRDLEYDKELKGSDRDLKMSATI
jgi:hypothetical protein